MDTKLKIGLDIHGVTDRNEFFKIMAKSLLLDGHEIHIITGAAMSKAKKDLRSIGMVEGINYTKIFSITEQLISEDIPVVWKNSNNPMFPDEAWNKAKAIYCEETGIDIHFDDSDIYGMYFKTPYAQVK